MDQKKHKSSEIRICEWNDQRNITIAPDDFIVLRTIIEELFEYLGVEGKEAKDLALRYTAKFRNEAVYLKAESTVEQKIDALCDVVVLSHGFTHRLGYNPQEAMNQTLLEIEDRTGDIGSDGKWYKHTDPEITKNWYKADYSIAEYKN